jgi:exopolyphosphatase/guanosine-5'-triphosphate,3'-diphosphate pyrophosphatase
MSFVRRAVIDVGTNSVKLLVAEVEGGNVRPVSEESHQTRLGSGFYPSQYLQTGPLVETAKSVAEFAKKAGQLGVGVPKVVATSAAREAKNRQDLVQAVERASGLPLRVITGEEEANYVFAGVCSDPHLHDEPMLLLDVGGGSTEFIVGKAGRRAFARSFPLGTVRLLEQLKPNDPPSLQQREDCRAELRRFLQSEVSPALRPALERETASHLPSRPIMLVGTGGTASILGCMEAKLTRFDRRQLEATRLSLESVRTHVENLWALPLAARRSIVGLPPNRADVILTGAAIYEALMDCYGLDELRISTRGLRFAIVMEAD